MAQRDQIFTGTRPLSLGGAFLAVADDGHAIFWNPAGLARLERIEAAFDYANLFGIGIDEYHASFFTRLYFIPPLTDYVTTGVDWTGIHAGDEELEFRRDQFNFALALQSPRTLPLLRDFGLGMNIKYLRLDARLDDMPEVDASGWGWDLGLLCVLREMPIVPGNLNLGVMIHDAGGTEIIHKNTNLQETAQQQNVRWGLSYRPFTTWPGNKIPVSDPVLAFDLDERIHAGLEFWLLGSLALRMGWQKDLHTEESATLSFGLGLKASPKNWPEAKVDYGLSDHPALPNTNRQFGAALVFRDNPRLLRIEEAHINDVFAALYQAYARPEGRLGIVKIKNVFKDTLRASVTFEEAGSYFEKQQPQTVVLPPAATVDLPLRANFKPQILRASANRLSGTVKARYLYQDREYGTSSVIDFALHERNYLTWDDPAKAAAFVTLDDPVVRAFVDASLRHPPDAPAWVARYRLADAMLIFDALQSYGVEYRLDPVTPFPALASAAINSFRLDRVYYPAELLTKEKRFGDCDDLTVLYASLLQNAGIPTAMVTGPGHILLMFDSGVPESQGRVAPFDPGLLIARNGTLWIPVEATMIPQGEFIAAWENAARRLVSDRADSTWSVLEVAASQTKYPPAPAQALPFLRAFSPVIPDFSALWQRELTAARRLQEQHWHAFEDSLRQEVASTTALAIRNRYGISLGKNGEPERAALQFQRILSQDTSFAAAWNNLGNAAFVLGRWAQAESLYFKALELNPYSHSTHLNLSILYEAVLETSPQDSLALRQMIVDSWWRVSQLLEGNPENAFALLGLPEERLDVKAGGVATKTDSMLQRVKKMIDRGFRRLVQKREIRKVPIGRHGVKAEESFDPDRAEMLSWI